jgi:hypothetical protein
LSKYIYAQKGVNPFDTVLFANFVSLAGTVTIILCKSQSFYVEPHFRRPLFIRSVIGLIGLMSLSFASILVPMTV